MVPATVLPHTPSIVATSPAPSRLGLLQWSAAVARVLPPLGGRHYFVIYHKHCSRILQILLHYQRYDHENPNCQHLAKGYHIYIFLIYTFYFKYGLIVEINVYGSGNSAMLWLWSECTEHLLLTISPLYHGTVRFESDESFTSIFFQFFRTFDRAR